ncbi:hypothetical protein D7009_17115 [Escherichia coli]|nr:hypothetical protein [Escherichia coli]
MSKKETTEVAVKNTQMSAMADFVDMTDFGAGFEDADADAYAIPFIVVLQKMSPMVDEDDPKHVPGAKAGMLYNTVTGELYDGKKGVQIIPCAFKRTFILWGGRESDDKGFKGEFTKEHVDAEVAAGRAVEINGKVFVPDENGKVHEKKSPYYADTRNHFVILLNEETGEFGSAMLSLTSSMIKPSRMLMTALQQKKVQTPQGLKTPPTFMNIVRMGTASQSKDGNTWSVLKFELEGLVQDKGLYEVAKAFHNDVVGGNVNIDRSKQEEASGAAGPVNETPTDAEEF